MRILWILMLTMVFIAGVTADNLRIYEQQKIEQEVKTLIAVLDNHTRGNRLQDNEYIVTLFQQILETNPSIIELHCLERLMHGDKCSPDVTCEVKLKRSQLLALLLCRKNDTESLNYEILQQSMPLLRRLELDTVPFWEPVASSQEPVVTASSKIKEERPNRGEYKLFHGYLHAHTSYSDGKGTPEEAYTMVRDVAKLDFFAVTDHAELIAVWPWDNKWEEIKKVADSFNKDHEFVALHGFEWSSPIFGHINVLHSHKLTNSILKIRVKDICKWIAEQPEAFARFNHPGRDKLGVEFDHFKLYPEVVEQMTSVEMFSKTRGIGHHVSNGYGEKYNYLDDANLNGWKVGVVGGQDNHEKNWGLRNNFNVGAWATELTRKGIIDAYRARRTYASEDRNLSLSFKIDGAQMGSFLRQGAKTMTIKLSDPDRENFTQVDIYKNGILFRRLPTKGSEPEISLDIKTVSEDYYYVLVTQQDGDKALSSPIWIIE